jgi:hypothetical protein
LVSVLFLYAKFTYLKNNAFSVFSKSRLDGKLKSIAMGGQHAGFHPAFEYKHWETHQSQWKAVPASNPAFALEVTIQSQEVPNLRFIRKHLGRENMNEKAHVTPFECRNMFS